MTLLLVPGTERFSRGPSRIDRMWAWLLEPPPPLVCCSHCGNPSERGNSKRRLRREARVICMRPLAMQTAEDPPKWRCAAHVRWRTVRIEADEYYLKLPAHRGAQPPGFTFERWSNAGVRPTPTPDANGPQAAVLVRIAPDEFAITSYGRASREDVWDEGNRATTTREGLRRLRDEITRLLGE